MIQTWKVPHIVKGILTHVPALNRLRQRRASTSGTNSARYCYSVWLRHLTILAAQGFHINGAAVGELGPGDSIGIGLAALLSGANSYVGLDIVPFSATANLTAIFDELAGLYAKSEPIPDEQEFPRVRPRLGSYNFPATLIEREHLETRADSIRSELRRGPNGRGMVSYCAPWDSANVLRPGSLDLIYSQAVLEHVDDLEKTYSAMSAWLRPGGYASHVIDFGSHNLSPYWNGHRAYTDHEWRLVRGQREFLLNREPFGSHLRVAEQANLDVVKAEKDCDDGGLAMDKLAPKFKSLGAGDRRTRGCILILRKRG